MNAVIRSAGFMIGIATNQPSEESNVDAMKSEWINVKGAIWFVHLFFVILNCPL